MFLIVYYLFQVISLNRYFFNYQERKALLDACKVADVSVARLFNETSAVALSYGIFRKAELSSTPRNVVFVDLGHSKLSVFCAAFYNNKCQILAESHERNIGCRNFDWELLKVFAGQF